MQQLTFKVVERQAYRAYLVERARKHKCYYIYSNANASTINIIVIININYIYLFWWAFLPTTSNENRFSFSVSVFGHFCALTIRHFLQPIQLLAQKLQDKSFSCPIFFFLNFRGAIHHNHTLNHARVRTNETKFTIINWFLFGDRSLCIR